MRHDGKQAAVASHQSDAAALLQRLGEWYYFVHECRACQHELAPSWPLCTHCEIRLATHCPRCESPLPPVGAYGCPGCGLAMPPAVVAGMREEMRRTAW